MQIYIRNKKGRRCIPAAQMPIPLAYSLSRIRFGALCLCAGCIARERRYLHTLLPVDARPTSQVVHSRFYRESFLTSDIDCDLRDPLYEVLTRRLEHGDLELTLNLVNQQISAHIMLSRSYDLEVTAKLSVISAADMIIYQRCVEKYGFKSDRAIV